MMNLNGLHTAGAAYSQSGDNQSNEAHHQRFIIDTSGKWKNSVSKILYTSPLLRPSQYRLTSEDFT